MKIQRINLTEKDAAIRSEKRTPLQPPLPPITAHVTFPLLFLLPRCARAYRQTNPPPAYPVTRLTHNPVGS